MAEQKSPSTLVLRKPDFEPSTIKSAYLIDRTHLSRNSMDQLQHNVGTNMIQQALDGSTVDNNVQQQGAPQSGFVITTSAMALWDYVQTIVQDEQEHAQTHPHAACPPRPPIPMSRRDRCILTLILEEKRDNLK
ncbi:uncharacterized protein EDB93DRAFT_1249544 [Suillus bovinus]|uniref:uncharacterized protein n=1 Tax=Suillus bovinus TaxID=48563 RepID=UPI001B8830C0|nr:uncharacterized protein EDB93DRAFT_1249544 [Suillus bovinus]KAG2151049.1 hypothetical protein EDB93DRAFT_1249544 [Suillus bovinus]